MVSVSPGAACSSLGGEGSVLNPSRETLAGPLGPGAHRKGRERCESRSREDRHRSPSLSYAGHTVAPKRRPRSQVARDRAVR